MHEYERLEAYQVKKILKKLEETVRKKFGVSERGLGDEKTEVSRERLTEMSCRLHKENILAISKSWQMKVSRGVEQFVEVGVEKMVVDRCKCWSCVEEQTTNIKNRNSIDRPSYREAIKEARTFSIDPPGVEEVSRLW